MLRTVGALLAGNDMEASDRIGPLKQMLAGSFAEAAFARLEREIGRYNFDGAAEALLEIEETLGFNIKGGDRPSSRDA